MKIVYEMSLLNFEAWSGGQDTKEAIIKANKVEEFDQLMEDLYPRLDATQLNDILWFDYEWIFEALGIEDK